MSGGALVIAIVAAVLFVGFAVQVTARQLQRYPVDTRQAGPLVDTKRETSWVVQTVELEQLSSIVSESLSSQAVARTKLWPIVDDLERAAPARARTASASKSGGRRPRDRRRQLEDRIASLETAWGIDDDR